jgi:endonuclease/exonuclease/phosphatase family metal-dependent hydrolase
MAEPRAGAAHLGDLVVATFNVHGCIGRDGVCRPDRTAAVLRDLGADVIALQEVDSRPHKGACETVDQFEYLANATGMEAVAGSTMASGDGRYGNVVLTRLPVLAVDRHDISYPRREPRGILDLVLDAGDCRLRVLTTHLGLVRSERHEQVRRVVDLLDRPPASHRADVVVVMGDLNEWRRRRCTVTPLDSRLHACPRFRTFPARRPLFALDRMWTGPDDLLKEIAVDASDAARGASDHLPLRARLDLSAARGRD